MKTSFAAGLKADVLVAYVHSRRVDYYLRLNAHFALSELIYAAQRLFLMLSNDLNKEDVGSDPCVFADSAVLRA